jgi:riboflavin transporter FmnP
MNVLAGVTLVGVAATYYRVEHTKRGAVRGLVLAIAVTTAVMIIANVLLTPIFYGLPRAQVIALVLPALLPFNLLKGLLNALITFYVYKRVRAYFYDLGDRAAW